MPPQRSNEVLEFLAGVFETTTTPINLRPEVLDWKFFAPHPWWPTGRSYVIETEAGIAAHGCAAPVRFVLDGKTLESAVIFDWASGRLLPGAGLLVWRNFAKLVGGPLLAIGGTSEAQRVTSQVKWFRPRTPLYWYARPLKPWKRLMRSPRTLRDWLKFGRNLQWSLFPSLPPADGWTCRPAQQNDPVFTPQGDFIAILRTKSWIDYLAACPIANCKVWILQHDGNACGHALVANLAGSVRIADFALQGNASHDFRVAAFSALVRLLRAHDDAMELVAGSSLEEEVRMFEACGLHPRGSDRVLSAEIANAFPPDKRLEIKPALNDAYYLHDPQNPFWL